MTYIHELSYPGATHDYIHSIFTLSLLPALRQLLDTGAVGVRREKMYKLDDHVACAVAGITGQIPVRQICLYV
jgi:hypothetical protein